MKPNIFEFIKVAKEQITGQGTTELASEYIRTNKGFKEELKIEISFGIGRSTSIPWIAFTGFNQSIQNGIYPVYLYYKSEDLLILAYGISENNSPNRYWKSTNLNNTIKAYFKDYKNKKPEKYGSSIIFKVYDPDSLPTENELENDLSHLIAEFKNQFIRQSKIGNKRIKVLSEDFLISKFDVEIYGSGLKFSKNHTLRFVSSLISKPFLILTGLSGSGKTKLAQAFAEWISEDENQIVLIPVGADWTNREPLLGYPNGLENNKYVKPENGALTLILDAISNPNKPYFLILDEMNLSHVERYFADFLSAMESKKEIRLHDFDDEINGIPKQITLPKNLFIIGTVNIDETTYMFSPKVLDRANVIEFRVDKKDIHQFLKEFKTLKINELKSKGAPMAQSFLKLSDQENIKFSDIEDISIVLVSFFNSLSAIGAEFGYRTATEILRLILQLRALDNTISRENCLDIAIMQKLLPKLHGSRRKLIPVLKILGQLCLMSDKVDIEKEVFNNPDFETGENVSYPLSLEKIKRMYKNAIEHGFASYAEA